MFSPELSDAFGEAMDLREKVDYDMLTNASVAQAKQLLGNAKQFVDRTLDHLEANGYV